MSERYRELSPQEWDDFVTGKDMRVHVELVSGEGFVVDTWKEE